MTRQYIQYHPVIGYTYLPDLRVRVPHEAGGYLIRTNSSGFRSSYELADRPGARRHIAIFGDSYTAGDGVSNGKRYSDVLQELLGDDVWVHNFGLPGTGTDQQYLAYEVFAKDHPWDLIIISVLVENIRRTNARYRPFRDDSGTILYRPKPYYTLSPDGTLSLHHQPVPKKPVSLENLPPEERAHVDSGGRMPTVRRVIGALGSKVKDSVQKLTKYQPLPEYNSSSSPEWLLQRAVLSHWISSLSCPAVLFVLPTYQYVEETADPTYYQERYREFAIEQRIELLDPLPKLQLYSPSERRAFRFQKDVHPTPELHRVLGNILADKVRPYLKG